MNAFWGHVLAVASVNGVAAWGLGLAMRSGQISLGHAAFLGLSAYASGLISKANPGILPVALLAGVLVAGLAGLLFSLLIGRLQHLFIALATLVLAEALRVFIASSETLGEAIGLTGIPLLVDWKVALGVVAAVLAFEVFVLRGSRFEALVNLLADAPELIGLAGESWLKVRVIAFTASCAAVGLAGALQAHIFGVIQPADMQVSHSIDLLAFVVIGGLHSGYGPIAGAFALTLVPEVLSFAAVDRMALYGFVLVAVLVVREQGIFPRRAVPVLKRLGKNRGSPERDRPARAVSANT